MDGKDFVALKELAIELKIGDAVLAKLGVITPSKPMTSLQVDIVHRQSSKPNDRSYYVLTDTLANIRIF